jgi:hypothetical protein
VKLSPLRRPVAELGCAGPGRDDRHDGRCPGNNALAGRIDADDVEFVLGSAPTYTSHNRRPLAKEIDALEPRASTNELVEGASFCKRIMSPRLLATAKSQNRTTGITLNDIPDFDQIAPHHRALATEMAKCSQILALDGGGHILNALCVLTTEARELRGAHSDSERLWKAFVKGYVEAAKEVEKPTPTQGGSPQFSSRPVLRDLRRSMLRRKMHG